MGQRADEYVAPETATEQKLAAIWSEVLGVAAERIGRRSDFFSLGGHSLSAVRVIGRIGELWGIELKLAKIFENAQLANIGQEIDATLASSQHKIARPRAAISPVDRSGALPLSFEQQRMWILNRSGDANDTSYNVFIVWTLSGNLDVGAFTKSFQTIVDRHEILRTRYELADGELVQVVKESDKVELSVIDVDVTEIDARIQSYSRHVFDLSTGPVYNIGLLRLSEREHIFIVNVHHIAIDGWSVANILLGELRRLYAANSQGTAAGLPALPVQYADYAHWQRHQDVSEQLGYWRESLSGYEDSLELPSDFVRSAQSGRRSDKVRHRYSAEFSGKLQEFSQSHGCTLFMSLLAGYYLVLSRYTGRTDICIGTTTAGRMHPELEPLIGFFINILPLRLQLDDEMDIGEFIARVRQVSLNGFDNQMVSFEEMLNALNIDRSGKANPLVPVIVRHQNFLKTRRDDSSESGLKFGWLSENASNSEGADTAGSGIDGAAQSVMAARCELEISYTGDGKQLDVEVVYASDIYTKETVTGLLSHHERLLEGILADADRSIRDLPLLDEKELRRQCVDYNDNERAVDVSRSFVHRFESQAHVRPDAVACYDREGAWSYRDMEKRSNRLAHALLESGVKRGDLVGICLERGADMLMSMLGIWKAGAAYVPLDPDYPEEYLRQILEDASPRCVVSTGANRSKLKLSPQRCYALDERAEDLSKQSEESLVIETSAEDLAYLMYTSGSTGVPKGALVPHRQLLNWLEGIESNWPFEAGEVIAQKTTMAFAVSVKELFAGLLNGCPLVFIDGLSVRDPEMFVERLRSYKVSRVNMVPSHLRSVLEHLESSGETLPALKYCITAGEPLTGELVTAFRGRFPGAKLLNNFGCTELNDIAYYDTENYRAETGFVPIGRPIQNTKVYILDRQGRLVPQGVAGELHVAGMGMSKGYHHRPELTNERYLSNPFDTDSPGSLYNTGDVVKYCADGNLEYIGRWDFQVKVRGFRVDVRQVEKVLGDYAGMGARAVVGQKDRLVAYYVATGDDGAFDLKDLHAYLGERLPEYMVPDGYVKLSSLPQLPNGKLDRRALMMLDAPLQQSEAYEAPVSETERLLAGIWAQVLEAPPEQIGRNTNFFHAGGHSLSAVRVLSRIKKDFHVDMSLADIFQHTRLSALGDAIDGQRGREVSETFPLVAIKRGEGELPMSYAQQRMWFLNQYEGGRDISYNLPGAVRFKGPTDIAALEKAINAVIARHESLRTTFDQIDDRPVQRIAHHLEVRIPVIEASETEVEGYMQANAAHVFDLKTGPLVKIEVLKLSAEDHVVLMNMHHIISDGWSMGFSNASFPPCAHIMQTARRCRCRRFRSSMRIMRTGNGNDCKARRWSGSCPIGKSIWRERPHCLSCPRTVRGQSSRPLTVRLNILSCPSHWPSNCRN